MSQAERAIERLYEDASLRDDLRDEEAAALLKWAEAQINQIVTAQSDDGVFEQQVDGVRTLVKGINRLVGRRGELDVETRQKRLTDLANAAPGFGAQAVDDRVSTLAEQLGTLDDSAALAAVTALFGGTVQAADTQSAVAPPTPAEPMEPVPPTHVPENVGSWFSQLAQALVPPHDAEPSAIVPAEPHVTESSHSSPASDSPTANQYPGRTPLYTRPQPPTGAPAADDETQVNEE